MGKFLDKAAMLGAAVGTILASGKDCTFDDSVKLGAAMALIDEMEEDEEEEDECSESSNHEYDDLFLDSEQEEELENAGIDLFEFECMNDDEKIEALEDAGLDPYDFDIF